MWAWKASTAAVAAAVLAATAASADEPLEVVVGPAEAQAGPAGETLTLTGPLSGTGTVTFAPPALQSEYWLGAVVNRPSPALRAQLSLPQDQGLLVEALQPESPAVKAGLRQYDILLKGNDKPLTGLEDLVQLIGQVKDGKLTLELLRAGKHEKVTVTPAKRPANEREGVGGLPLVFNLVRPGQILPPGGNLYIQSKAQDLADGSKVEITQQGSEPAKVVVTREKHKWEGTSTDLSNIPAKIRPEVEKLLHSDAFATTHEGILTLLGNGITPAGIPGQPAISPDVEKRFGEIQKQLDELRRSIDAIQGKAQDKSAAKSEYTPTEHEEKTRGLAGFAAPASSFFRPHQACSSLSKAESKARRLGSKSTLRTNWQDSRAPCSRSIPMSSHSTLSGP